MRFFNNIKAQFDSAMQSPQFQAAKENMAARSNTVVAQFNQLKENGNLVRGAKSSIVTGMTVAGLVELAVASVAAGSAFVAVGVLSIQSVGLLAADKLASFQVFGRTIENSALVSAVAAQFAKMDGKDITDAKSCSPEEVAMYTRNAMIAVENLRRQGAFDPEKAANVTPAVQPVTD
jgi:hypothetical protein